MCSVFENRDTCFGERINNLQWLVQECLYRSMEVEPRFIADCWTLVNYYRWLLDSYILDFFVSEHWDQLPECWKKTLEAIGVLKFSKWFIQKKSEFNLMVPLGLLALKASAQYYQLPRQVLDPRELEATLIKYFNIESHETNHPSNLICPKVLYKHVKLKKQHEIMRIQQVVQLLSHGLNCKLVVDVGSGLGHLSRSLTWVDNLKVICLEQAEELVSTARKFDQQVKKELQFHMKKANVSIDTDRSDPVHIIEQVKLEAEDGYRQIPAESHANYGLLGLHSCGELSCSLLRQFVGNEHAKFVVNAPCCYMRTSERQPMSAYLRQVVGESEWMTYEMLQTACHGLESFTDQLSDEGSKLKVHCYRAVLEWILIKRTDYVKHSRLNHVNKAHTLTFSEYARRATANFKNPITEEETLNQEVVELLERWECVVLFYTIKLMLSPVVETLILLDRLQYLKEHGHRGFCLPLFDPRMSPRNSIVVSVKSINS